MKSVHNTWAVVLAAGDGTRLSTLTTDLNGNAVPKQYCSLNGGASLLHEAVLRAQRIVPRERICAIVADQHRRYWRKALWALTPDNIIVQPSNRGTANGILLSTLEILERDPFARIVFLPADHFVRDEHALARSLQEAVGLLSLHHASLTLIGIEPDEADTELGYIVPAGELPDGSYAVGRFVEKPTAPLVRELLSVGAVWNSFIFAASGLALLTLLRERMPASVDQMATALARDDRSCALASLYDCLPAVDFSRSIIEGSEPSLRLIRARACGWSDLGTPQRVADALCRLRLDRTDRLASEVCIAALHSSPALINLAAQHARLGVSP